MMFQMLSEPAILLYVIEMVLNTFGLLVSIMFLSVLWKTKLFLRNQKFYLSNVMVANIITIICRYPLLVQLLSERKLYSQVANNRLNQVHDLADSVVVNMITQLIIFGNVTMVVMGRNELHFSWAILLCFVSWILAQVNIKLGSLNIPPPLYSQLIMELLNFTCWLAFAGLIYMGRMKYRQQTIGDIKHKYLMSICLRTLEVLKIMAICSAIRNFICINVIISLFVYIRPNHDLDGERFVSFFYDLTISFYAAIVPFLMILSHEEMSKTYSKICAPKSESPILKISSSDNATKFVAKNIVGDVITPVEQDEAVYHFKQLQNNWNNTRRLSAQHLSQGPIVKQAFVKVHSIH